MGSENPGKLWNFILAFQNLKFLGRDYSSWKVLEICLNEAVRFSEFMLHKIYVDGKEN